MQAGIASGHKKFEKFLPEDKEGGNMENKKTEDLRTGPQPFRL
jgi:hypothetical protein